MCDGFHMNVIYGRYLLGVTWYKTLFGKFVTKNPYIPSTALAPNAVCNEQILNVVKKNSGCNRITGSHRCKNHTVIRLSCFCKRED